MMVSIAIFAIVMTMSMGALLNIIDINKKSQSVKTIMDNLDFALEEMARDIRFGTGYSGSGTTFSIQFQGVRDASAHTVTFSEIANPSDASCYEIAKTDAGNTIPLTAPEACITNLAFSPSSGSGIQPRVLITVSGHAGTGKTQTNFNLQTTVSQRQLNVAP